MLLISIIIDIENSISIIINYYYIKNTINYIFGIFIDNPLYLNSNIIHCV